MSEERRIVVSIDFGTTFSGVAWADTTQVSPSSSTQRFRAALKPPSRMFSTYYPTGRQLVRPKIALKFQQSCGK